MQCITNHDLDLVHYCSHADNMDQNTSSKGLTAAKIRPQADNGAKLIVKLGETGSYDKQISL